ncbi:hypothetical protein WG66_009719, partial [Moniliophthora roreri]
EPENLPYVLRGDSLSPPSTPKPSLCWLAQVPYGEVNPLELSSAIQVDIWIGPVVNYLLAKMESSLSAKL